MTLLSHGYVLVKQKGHPRARRDGYVFEHILVAEKALGKPLPRKALIHHVNENERDNANSNLVICQDQAYHSLLHRRMRVLKAGGIPGMHRICSDCGALRILSDFNSNKTTYDGRCHACKDCTSAFDKRRRGRSAKDMALISIYADLKQTNILLSNIAEALNRLAGPVVEPTPQEIAVPVKTTGIGRVDLQGKVRSDQRARLRALSGDEE